MSWMKLANKLEPYLRQGNLNYCIEQLIETIKLQPESPFHQIINLNFTNNSKEIAKYFQKFIDREKKKYSIKAIYTETNGFDINPNEWFFDLFAFKSYSGHSDYDWLSDWQSEEYKSLTLTGMEKLQLVYKSDAFCDNQYDDVSSYCSLMVVLRFQQLIEKSAPYIKNLDFPILATSHDYEFIYEYNPNSEPAT